MLHIGKFVVLNPIFVDGLVTSMDAATHVTHRHLQICREITEPVLELLIARQVDLSVGQEDVRVESLSCFQQAVVDRAVVCVQPHGQYIQVVLQVLCGNLAVRFQAIHVAD